MRFSRVSQRVRTTRLAGVGLATHQGVLLAAGLMLVLLGVPQQARADEPCCSIVSINAGTGIVTARVQATGQTFEFAVTNHGVLAGLKLGQRIYANLAGKEVSLDGKTVCCQIVSISGHGPAAPAARPPVPPPAPPARPTPDAAPAAPAPPSPAVPAPAGAIVRGGVSKGPILIQALAVRVITSNEEGAGTDDEVFFSIGPLGWRLNKRGHNDFEHGADDTYDLAIPSGLTTDDMVLLGLQKKGIGPPGNGLYNAPDGLGGAWRPHKVTLYVNGAPYPDDSCCLVDQWLEQGHALWNHYLRACHADECLVRSLRLSPNDKLTKDAELLAFLTTPAGKERGISGWLPQEIGPSCATGTVVWPPATSTDGLATIDLQVGKFEAGRLETTTTHEPLPSARNPGEAKLSPQSIGRPAPATTANKPEQFTEFLLDGTHGIAHTRYLRVEYAYHNNPLPAQSQLVRICGTVWRDMDKETWLEIHPRGASDVTLLSAPPPASARPVK